MGEYIVYSRSFSTQLDYFSTIVVLAFAEKMHVIMEQNGMKTTGVRYYLNGPVL